MNIPLGKMEELEDKYGVELFIEQVIGKKDRFYKLVDQFPLTEKKKVFLGNTLKQVEKRLKDEHRKSQG